MSARPTLHFVSRVAVALAFGALGACGAGPHGNGTVGGSPSAGASRVERRELDHHPPINLVVRLGDPQAALALASAQDFGPAASVAVSALILARLRAHGLTEVVSMPTDAGLELAILCADRAAARAFVEQVTRALATPLVERDDALPAIQEALSALRGRSFAGQAQATLASCSGELGLAPGAAVPDLRTAVGRAEFEKYRQFAFTTRASAFAALGSSDFVDAAASELGKVADWPRGDAATDAWPDADASYVDASDGRRHLSVALRVADADRALASLASLSAPDSDLGLRLRTFAPSFSLQRLGFLARPRGACMRADLDVSPGDPGPSLNEATIAASVVSDELRTALAASVPEHAIDESIVEPSDPREAAARAAWRALTGRLEPGPERRLIALTVHPSERAQFNNLASALDDFEKRPARAALETKIHAEAGQGELWLLVGSPCGTLAESNEDAGQSALALTLAAHAASSGVTLEPWLTADAVGLLAHAARKPNESALEQGERIARALARALTERDTAGSALATTESELFGALGAEPRPGYARLLDALSPDHIAWLEPRGTWMSLAQANHDSVSARGRDLLRGPLRVAVLSNQDDAQGAATVRAFERWLAPWRDEPRRCQATAERAARSTEITLSVSGDSAAESAYVGLPFSSRLKFDREAEAVAALLNSGNGLLVRALGANHISASTRATVIGGGRVAALVVAIHASDEEARRATQEVRRVLERLAQSPLSADELKEVIHAAERRIATSALDPRRRVVDLWRGALPASPPNPLSVRAFQAALTPAAEVVVYVTHKD
ncbi:MAG TPA: hypothetical protein VGM44_21905 [Polyangiaceae bacterium]